MRNSEGETPEYCAIELAMEVLGGRWKLAIMKRLFIGTQRFGELKRAMPRVTQRMLTRQLRELEADGLITRTVYREVPPKVEYSLTDTGRSLEQIADLLDTWGRHYRDTVREPNSPAPRMADTPAPRST
ncbi:winged helix-turn-helix transcriptional regulator [Streptomyces platensis]|uniref:winged helix-turn-helix transcriptional regulator n=1 Tax=Streptomyces platensis TaxID=58346 RepID=UPI00386FBF8D|nr:helix-turn-helix transcriptional regulator [Streptomyces platensis]